MPTQQEIERVTEAQEILSGKDPYRGDWIYFGRDRDQIEAQAREILRAAGLLEVTEMLGQYDDEIIEVQPGIDEYIQSGYEENYWDYYNWDSMFADSYNSDYPEFLTDEELGLDTSDMYARTDEMIEQSMYEATQDLSWYDEIIAGHESALPDFEEMVADLGLNDDIFAFMPSGVESAPKTQSTASKIASKVASVAAGAPMSASSGGSSQVPKTSTATDTATKAILGGIAALLGQKQGVNVGSTNPYVNAAVGVGSRVANSIWGNVGGTVKTAATLQAQSLAGTFLPWAVVGGLAYFLFRKPQ
jgi:hypothetical protein